MAALWYPLAFLRGGNMPIRRLSLGILALVFSAEAALAAGAAKDGAIRLLDGHDFAAGRTPSSA